MMLFATALGTLLAATSPGAIADPRPASQVVDLTGTLGPAQIAAINGDAQRGRAGGELMVVVVRSTDGMNPRQWTTDVFNRWGLDEKARNRGVLLMAAIGDRKAEIVIGDGFPGEVTRTTDAIMADVVVARFKAGDPQGALVQGARAIVDRVLVPGGAPATASTEPWRGPVLDVAPDVETTAPPPPPAEVVGAARAPVVLSVPDPRASRGVVDGARVFSKRELAELRDALAALPKLDAAVVTATETGGLDAATFARGLFLRLQSEAGAERAALLVVIAPRAAKQGPPAPPAVELVLSAAFPPMVAEGKDAQVSAAWLAAVAQDPKARGAATLQAVRSLAGLDEELTQWQAQWQAQQAKRAEDARRARMAEAQQRAEQAAATAAIEEDHRREPPLLERLGLWGMGAVGLGFCGFLLGVRELVRRWPRKCAKCRVPMERLGEELDDQHLSEGEKAEERVGSVDYDVWSCPECGELRKLRWGALITSYSRCTSCSFRTLSSTSRTLQAATQYSTGLAEVTESCAHCGFHRVYTRTIPRRPKPSSSGSSSSGRSSRGSSSGRGSSGSW